MNTAFATDPGSSERLNEDFVAATHGAVVLLDGAGGPQELDSGCVHGARWYVRQLGSRLLVWLANDPDISLVTALSRTIAEVAAQHADTCDLEHPGTPSATVAVLREGADSVDYLVLSDSVVVLERADGSIEAVTDRRIDRVAVDEQRAMARYATGTEEHQRHRIASVLEQRQWRNRLGGFWVAAADPEAARQAVTGAIQIDQVRRAALLTDGAARIVDFELASWVNVLDLLGKEGPHALLDRVRAAEDSDPDGSRWPRTKHRDDATVVFCDFRSDTPRPTDPQGPAGRGTLGADVAQEGAQA